MRVQIIPMSKVTCGICSKEKWVFPKNKEELQNYNCDECLSVEVKELPNEDNAIQGE